MQQIDTTSQVVSPPAPKIELQADIKIRKFTADEEESKRKEQFYHYVEDQNSIQKDIKSYLDKIADLAQLDEAKRYKNKANCCLMSHPRDIKERLEENGLS